MTIIKPFRAIRPNQTVVNQVAALPYDVYNQKEARDYVRNRPYSFLNIDRPETQFEPNHNLYADDVYRKARQMLEDQISKGIFIQDESPFYYIYELTMNQRSQTGIVALSSIDDYADNICRKHENTVETKLQDRIRHVDTCSAQTGPIFLAYRSQAAINQIVDTHKKGKPIYDFVSEDSIRHRVWIIDDLHSIRQVEDRFKTIENTYIADGHHRCESAVQVGYRRRKRHPNYTGKEEFNYFLSVLFPDDQLAIFDYNRFVKDLNGLSPRQFLDAIAAKFDITELNASRHPTKKYQINMYFENTWYQLDTRQEIIDQRKDHPVHALDVAILQEEILAPILGINDPRTDTRIEFIGGIRGLNELTEKVNRTSVPSAAFAMYPTSIKELFAVADAQLLMPPKSTWFEPKLRSGLFIHEIEM